MLKRGSCPVQRTGLRLIIASLLMTAGTATLANEGVTENPAKVRQALDLAVDTQQQSQRSQQQVDQLDDETRRMLEEYRSILRQTDSQRIYNEQMQALVNAQQTEIGSLEEQIGGIEQTQQAILPLMKRMVDTLAHFVALDLPFLPQERAQRLQTLNSLLTRADVSVSEKYRRILEAYQIENDYGRTIEAYQGRLGEAGDAPLVEFLRLGRVALYYLSLNGQQVGMWDAQRQQWTLLDNRYRRVVRQGLRMARQQATPDLLELPLPSPTDAPAPEGSEQDA